MGAKEPQRRRRGKWQLTRRGLWRVGHSLDLKRAHNPKVVGSNPTPATMNDEGLAITSLTPSSSVALTLPETLPSAGSAVHFSSRNAGFQRGEAQEATFRSAVLSE